MSELAGIAAQKLFFHLYTHRCTQPHKPPNHTLLGSDVLLLHSPYFPNPAILFSLRITHLRYVSHTVPVAGNRVLMGFHPAAMGNGEMS